MSPEAGPTVADEKSVAARGVDARIDRPPASRSTASAWDEAFEVRWDGDHDPGNPLAMPPVRKWLQVLITSSTAVSVTCTSSAYTQTYAQLMAEFHISEELATAGLSLYVVALGLSPMLFGPLSEFYGRRPIYVVSTGLFVVWLVPCAVAPNVATLLVARFFDGLVGSAFLSVAGGTVSDLFDQRSLQLPMLVFTSAPFLGPVIGPTLGGLVNQFANWRWTFYVLLIWATVQWALILTLLPETYHPVLLRRRAKQRRTDTGDERWHAPSEKNRRSKLQSVLHSCSSPFRLLTQEPMCLCLCLYSSLLLAILYLFFTAFPLVFENNHGFNQWQSGLAFCGIGTGMLMAMASDYPLKRRYYRQLEQYQKETGNPEASEPEFRLPPSIIGAPLVVIGLFWFGFTTYPQIHWIVPIIGSVFFGSGIILVFSGVFTFLVDAYPKYAASALSANSFTRSTAAAAFPLFGVQMYERLGYQWATGLVGFLCLGMAPFPYLFYRYGKRLRNRSKFAS